MKYLSGIVLLLLAGACSPAAPSRVLLSATRSHIPKEPVAVTLALPWSAVVAVLPEARSQRLQAVDQNTGGKVQVALVDANQDGEPEQLILQTTFSSVEPVFAYELSAAPAYPKATLLITSQPVDETVQMRILTPVTPDSLKEMEKQLPARLVETTLTTYPNPLDFPIYNPGKWNYEYAFFLLGAYQYGKANNRPAFVDYARQWLDSFIDSTGFKPGVYDGEEYKLDDVIPGRLALDMMQETGVAAYKQVADTLREQLRRQPRTTEGGYWHKKIYTNQMWLDGIFMADVFAMQYATLYGDTALMNESIHQIELMFAHAYDPATGLMYHGWDESKNPVWANPETGTSPSFWARAIGWYAMALVECLDYIPLDHPKRPVVLDLLKRVSAGIIRQQDAKTHLWYQVIDKGQDPDNWIETSASAMFAYAFAKASHRGYLDASYEQAAKQAYAALIANYVYIDSRQGVHLTQTVKIGTLNPKTSKGDFAYYVSTERRLDDYKGLAALLFAGMELNKQ